VAKAAGVPILGLGGIRTAADAIEFIIAGASAVAVAPPVSFSPDCTVRIIDGIRTTASDTRHKAIRSDRLALDKS